MNQEELFQVLTGRYTPPLRPLGSSSLSIHQEMTVAFSKLQKQAEQEQIQLEVVSAYRSFDRQLTIWNEKAQGKRAILDSKGRPLTYEELSLKEIVFAILRWSALPGASRHHWGSEIDIIDQNTLTEDYQVQLTPEEYAPRGIFENLGRWVESSLESPFYRPYHQDKGGVAPEPWHLSYRPVSDIYLAAYSLDLFKKNLKESPIELKDVILNHCEEIYHRFFLNEGHLK